jgi:hypothetical protein
VVITFTSHKNRAGGVAQGEGPELKPQYHKKKKKRSTFVLDKKDRMIFLKVNI